MNTKKLCEDLSDWPEDKQAESSWYNPDTGCFCAVGWLLHKNGTPLDIINRMFTSCFKDGEVWIVDEYTEKPIEAARALKKALDATGEEMACIWQANDGYRNGFRMEDGKTPKQRVQEKFCGV